MHQNNAKNVWTYKYLHSKWKQWLTAGGIKPLNQGVTPLATEAKLAKAEQ